MSHEETAKRIARFLKALATRIEEHPEFFAGLDLVDLPVPVPKKKAAPTEPPFDVFQVYFAEGADGLRRRCEAQEIKDLKAIIGRHGLDPSGLARNWRKREKLIELIVQRLEARGNKGEVFRA